MVVDESMLQLNPLINKPRLCGIGRRQHGLRFYPSLELLVQTLDRVRCPRAAPLGRWQASESEEAVASFLQAVGDSAMTQPPLADEGRAAGRDRLGRGRVDHVGVISGGLVVQALRRGGE